MFQTYLVLHPTVGSHLPGREWHVSLEPCSWTEMVQVTKPNILTLFQVWYPRRWEASPNSWEIPSRVSAEVSESPVFDDSDWYQWENGLCYEVHQTSKPTWGASACSSWQSSGNFRKCVCFRTHFLKYIYIPRKWTTFFFHWDTIKGDTEWSRSSIGNIQTFVLWKRIFKSLLGLRD